MRRTLAAMGLLGTGLAVLGGAPAHAADVTGTVRDGASAPVVGATVTAVVGGTTLGPVTTGAGGTYTLPGAPAGQYRIYVAPPAGALGFAITSATVGGTGGTVNVTLPAAATVSGTVTGPGATPLAGVQVAFGATPNAPFAEGALDACPIGGPTATTAADGTYTLTQVGAVNCPVVFTPPAGLAAEMSGDTIDPNVAQFVSVAGGNVTGVNAAIEYAGSIKGDIKTTLGAPAPFVGVYLSFADGRIISSAGPSATTLIDGTYEITGLKPGTYGLNHFGGGWSSLRTPLPVVIPSSATPNPAPVVPVIPPVTPLAPVAVTSVTPTQIAVGSTVNLHVNGTGFQAGATLDVYVTQGGQVNVTNVVVASPTLITARVELAAAPATGTLTVTVNNPDDGISSCAGCIAVTAGPAIAQTVTFTKAPPASVGAGSTFSVAAYASSGLDVALATSGACTGAGTNTLIVSAPAVGTCTITATQAGSAAFAAATPLVATVTVDDQTPVTVAAEGLVTMKPERLLDTRPGSQTGYTGDKPAAGTTVTLQVAGRAGIPADAAAVVLNVTGTEATAEGFVTVWPCGQPRPLASSLNLVPDVTSPNAVITKLGTGGTVCLYTQSGTHLIADANGWFPAGAAYNALVPERLLDTRPGSQIGHTGDKPAAGTTVTLQVAGRAGIPSDAAAVVLNVTGTEATAEGFVTVWPCGEQRPVASSLNLLPGVTSPNAVITKLGTGGTVCLYTQSGTHLIADANGWFPAGAAYAAVTPARLLDTRPGSQIGYTGDKPAAGATVTLQVTAPLGATAAVLNVTGTEATAEGFVTVWPCGEQRPLASSLNLRPGVTSPNAVIAKLGTGGTVCLYTQSGTHLLADVTGFVTA